MLHNARLQGLTCFRAFYAKSVELAKWVEGSKVDQTLRRHKDQKFPVLEDQKFPVLVLLSIDRAMEEKADFHFYHPRLRKPENGA